MLTLTEYPESVYDPVQGEKGPQDLRRVHAEKPAPPRSVHPVVHLPAGQQAEAENVSRTRHGEAPVHHPVLLAVQENVGVSWQVSGVQTRRVTGRQTKRQRAKVRQAQVAHLHVQSLPDVQRPVTEHQSPAAVQKVDAGGGAVGRQNHVRAPDGVKVQVSVQQGGQAPPDHPGD